MAGDPRPIDVSDSPELLRLAEEVQRSNRPHLLKRHDEELAMIIPLRPPRRRARPRGTITRDDPLWRIVGTGNSGIPGGISGDKYKYFREAFSEPWGPRSRARHASGACSWTRQPAWP